MGELWEVSRLIFFAFLARLAHSPLRSMSPFVTPRGRGIGVGFVLGLLYASQRRRPVPATLYRVASKEVDAKGLADLALAEVV